MNILALLEMNKDTIFKICIGVGILIGIIILFCFIRKHKGVCITLFLVIALLVLFYFLNSFLGFHFTNDLSRDSVRNTYSSENYVELKEEDITIYYKKAFNEDGSLLQTDGDFFSVEKVWFFYKEKKSKTYNYSLILGNSESVNIVVKELSVNEKYFYSFKIEYQTITSSGSFTGIENYYLNKVTINDKEYDLNNLYFLLIEEKISTIEVDDTQLVLNN